MKYLIKQELKRITLCSHFIGLIIANIIICFLGITTFLFLRVGEHLLANMGLPTIQLGMLDISFMLVRATLIVWQSVFIATIIIEEYKNKTISLLFSYPINRTRLIMSKIILICGIMLLFHIGSLVFQHGMVYLLSRELEFVVYSLGSLFNQIVITLSTILLGLFPLFVGMLKKSTIATIISSLIIIAMVSNSQGTNAGLLSLPLFAIVFGFIGLIFAAITIKKMITSDLYT